MDLDDDTPLGDALDGNDTPDEAPSGLQEVDADTPEVMVVDVSASCTNCAHRGVCAVWGNFRHQVAEEIPQRTGGEPAFEPDQLAIICDYYVNEEEQHQ